MSSPNALQAALDEIDGLRDLVDQYAQEAQTALSEGALKDKAIDSIYDGLSARQQESVDAILRRFPPASTRLTVKERIADPKIVDVDLEDLPPVSTLQTGIVECMECGEEFTGVYCPCSYEVQNDEPA